MYDIILKQLDKRKDPIDVIVVGLGFMGFGFVSSLRNYPGMRIPLVITRRTSGAKDYLEERGFKVKIEDNPQKVKDFVNRGYICVSDDLDLIETFEDALVIEMTGTVYYGTEVALRTLNAKKHFVTMNPELQATMGTELKKIADDQGVVITDVIGDQPGSLARLISQSKLLGFNVRMAGNMKRYMDLHATQEKMKPWADDKGLAVRQTVSFTDGTKQAIEMVLVANYFGMSVLQQGMKGPKMVDVKEALTAFDWKKIPKEGIVDYVIGMELFPGVCVVAEHTDPHQAKYLRYLGLGDGPQYILFEPYHLCHLEVAGTIAKVVLFSQETINNSLSPKTRAYAMAKFDLGKGTKLDGIGGDTVYGTIDTVEKSKNYLPVGFTDGAVLKRSVKQDEPVRIDDVILPINAATKLAGLVKESKHKIPVKEVGNSQRFFQ